MKAEFHSSLKSQHIAASLSWASGNAVSVRSPSLNGSCSKCMSVMNLQRNHTNAATALKASPHQRTCVRMLSIMSVRNHSSVVTVRALLLGLRLWITTSEHTLEKNHLFATSAGRILHRDPSLVGIREFPETALNKIEKGNKKLLKEKTCKDIKNEARNFNILLVFLPLFSKYETNS